MLNKIILIGRLGKDPEVRRLESGAAVAKFSMATDESYKDKDGNKVEQAAWHNIVLWNKLAEIAEKYLKKGHLVYVEGKITYREYTDKDNQKKYFTEVVANTFRILEKKETTSGDTGSTRNTGNTPPPPNEGEPDPPSDDLPF